MAFGVIAGCFSDSTQSTDIVAHRALLARCLSLLPFHRAYDFTTAIINNASFN